MDLHVGHRSRRQLRRLLVNDATTATTEAVATTMYSVVCVLQQSWVCLGMNEGTPPFIADVKGRLRSRQTWLKSAPSSAPAVHRGKPPMKGRRYCVNVCFQVPRRSPQASCSAGPLVLVDIVFCVRFSSLTKCPRAAAALDVEDICLCIDPQYYFDDNCLLQLCNRSQGPIMNYECYEFSRRISLLHSL